jgi:hypothetical protein
MIAIAAVGCRPSLVFNCASDTECAEGGVAGACEPTGYCSFADNSCPGGRRYGEWAGESLGGACVGADQPDGDPGAPDARIDAPANAVEVSFGETGTADFSGVTFDTTWATGSTTPSGADPHVSVELNEYGSIVRFEISSIPSGATIVSARVELATDADLDNLLSAGEARVHRLLETWDEDTATYVERSTGVAWSGAGAAPPSSDPAVLGSFTAAVEGRYSVDLPAAMVQDWLDDPATNAGLFLDTTPAAIGHLHIGAKEGLAPEAPLLFVSYVP